MSAGLRQAVADYLAVRRSLGFRLARPEKLLSQFAGYLEQAGAATVTTEHALAWAVLPGGHPSWHAYRLAVVRGFAAWLRTTDLSAEIPPAGLIPSRKPRATPYLYSDGEVAGLIAAAGSLRSPLRTAKEWRRSWMRGRHCADRGGRPAEAASSCQVAWTLR